MATAWAVGRLGGWAVGSDFTAPRSTNWLPRDFVTSLSGSSCWILASCCTCRSLAWDTIITASRTSPRPLQQMLGPKGGTTPADPASVETKDGWLNSRYHCGVCCFALRFAKSGNLKIYWPRHVACPQISRIGSSNSSDFLASPSPLTKPQDQYGVAPLAPLLAIFSRPSGLLQPIWSKRLSGGKVVISPPYPSNFFQRSLGVFRTWILGAPQASQGLGLHVGSRPAQFRERGGGMEQFSAGQLLHDGLPLWGTGPIP